MRISITAGLVVAAAALSGCGEKANVDEDGASARHGRYLGIGIFPASDLWSHMAEGDAPKDAAAASTADDDHIIVVVDSVSGEVRECGDFSGRCVSMNPWTKAIAASQAAPVTLTKHAAQIAKEAEEQAARREKTAVQH